VPLNNRERVGKGPDFLGKGLYDMVNEVMTKKFETSDWDKLWAAQDADKSGSSFNSTLKTSRPSAVRSWSASSPLAPLWRFP